MWLGKIKPLVTVCGNMIIYVCLVVYVLSQKMANQTLRK